jgi:thiamine biosynthesis lipoprotein
MSANLPDSYISRINTSSGIIPVQVPDDVFLVMERALYYAEISDGAFDPTVGPLVSLWGIGGDNERLPSQEEIDAVLPLVNWRNIELDPDARTVFLREPGMALDLGAIAKGFAVDEATVIIRNAGIKRAIVDLGGDVMTYGVKRDGTPWRIGLQEPDGNRGAFFGVVSGWTQTVVTSGVYERYFIEDGVRYHHIFSPFDGYPAGNNFLSVTLIADISMDADALSTAIFVMGYEKGTALIELLEGVEAVFVFDDMSVRITSGANFTLTNDRFRLLED